MPRIKVVWANTRDFDDNEVRAITGTTGDWKEVTDEELAILRRHAYRLAGRDYGDRAYIVEEDTRSVADLLAGIQHHVDAEQAAILARQRALAKAAKTRAKTALERKKKQLERLKRELGDKS